MAEYLPGMHQALNPISGIKPGKAVHPVASAVTECQDYPHLYVKGGRKGEEEGREGEGREKTVGR